MNKIGIFILTSQASTQLIAQVQWNIQSTHGRFNKFITNVITPTPLTTFQAIKLVIIYLTNKFRRAFPPPVVKLVFIICIIFITLMLPLFIFLETCFITYTRSLYSFLIPKLWLSTFPSIRHASKIFTTTVGLCRQISGILSFKIPKIVYCCDIYSVLAGIIMKKKIDCQVIYFKNEYNFHPLLLRIYESFLTKNVDKIVPINAHMQSNIKILQDNMLVK